MSNVIAIPEKVKKHLDRLKIQFEDAHYGRPYSYGAVIAELIEIYEKYETTNFWNTFQTYPNGGGKKSITDSKNYSSGE